MSCVIDEAIDHLSEMEPGEVVQIDLRQDGDMHVIYTKEVRACAKDRGLAVSVEREGRELTVQLLQVPEKK